MFKGIGEHDHELYETVAWTAGCSASPDGNRIVYVASGDTEPSELYLVDLAIPGVAAKLNGTLPAGGFVVATPGLLRMNPVMDQVAFTVFDVASGITLHFVDLDTPGASVQLGDLQAVGEPEFTADGSRIVIVGRNAGDGRDDPQRLYVLDPRFPLGQTELNAPLPTDAFGVRAFQITPDGNSVVFGADQETRNRDELFLVNLNEPGVAIRFSGDRAVAFSEVTDFAVRD